MSAIQSAPRIDVDEILYQSVGDDEFRAQLVTDPSLLGLGEQSLTFNMENRLYASHMRMLTSRQRMLPSYNQSYNQD
ncbi:MAG: hypothetical protein ACRDS9_09965 [Pseudonocardiaceae bacterium]